MVVSEVIVVAVQQHQARVIHHNAVLDEIGIVAIVKQAGLVLLPYAIGIERIVNVLVLDVEGIRAGCRIAAGAEIVGVAVDGHPLLGCPLTGPHIMRTVGVPDQVAPGQDVVLKDVVIAVDGLLAIHGRAGLGVEVEEAFLPLIVGQVPPAGLGYAVEGIVPCAVLLK